MVITLFTKESHTILPCKQGKVQEKMEIGIQTKCSEISNQELQMTVN